LNCETGLNFEMNNYYGEIFKKRLHYFIQQKLGNFNEYNETMTKQKQSR